MFEKIKLWHTKGLWTDDMVAEAVAYGVITEEQLKEIIPDNTPPIPNLDKPITNKDMRNAIEEGVNSI